MAQVAPADRAAAAGSGGTGGSDGGGVVSDLEVTTLIPGLDNPWDIAWLPNDNETVLVTERSGPLNVYVDGVGAPAVHPHAR